LIIALQAFHREQSSRRGWLARRERPFHSGRTAAGGHFATASYDSFIAFTESKEKINSLDFVFSVEP